MSNLHLKTTVFPDYRANGPEVGPLQPFQGLNPCLERNLHLESSDSSSGYGNRVVESNFDKVDPCTAENLAKFMPGALLALAKTSNNKTHECDKNERQYYSRPASHSVEGVLEGCQFNNNDPKNHLFELLLQSHDNRQPCNNVTSKKSNNTDKCNTEPFSICINDISNANTSNNCEPPEISPGGSTSVSSCDSAYDRHSLSVSEEATPKHQTGSVDDVAGASVQDTNENVLIQQQSKKRLSKTSTDFELDSSRLNFNPLSLELNEVV